MFEMNSGTAWVEYRAKKQHWALTTLKLLAMVVIDVIIVALSLLFATTMAALIVMAVDIVAHQAGHSLSEPVGWTIFGGSLLAVGAILCLKVGVIFLLVICGLFDWALGRDPVLVID